MGLTGVLMLETRADRRLQEPGMLATKEDSSTPPVLYFHFISNFLKPKKPTKAAMGLIETTVEMMKLNQQINSNPVKSGRNRAVSEQVICLG